MALITAEDVQKFLGLPVTVDAELLGVLAEAASAFVLAYCEVEDFTAKQYTLNLHGHDGKSITPPKYPITAIASLTIDDRAIPACVNGSDSGYVFDKHSIYLRGYRFTEGFLNVRIELTAGYAQLPADVKQACVELVAEKYKRKDRLGISSKTIGQESITYSQSDLTPNAKLVLNEYKMVRYIA